MIFDIIDELSADPSRAGAQTELTNLARALFCAQGIGFYAYDVATKLLRVDDVVLDILGLSAGDFDATKSWTEYVHPDDRAALGARMPPMDAMHPTDVTSYRVLRPGGEVRHVEAATVMDRDPDGHVVRVFGINRDVTERIELAERAAKADSRLNDAIDNLEAAVFQYQLNPDGSDRVDFLSPACETVWNVSEAELREQPAAIWSRIEAEDLGPMRASVEQSAKDLTPWRFEYRYDRSPGDVRWLQGRGRPRRLPNGGTLWNSLVIDVTEAKALQTELQRKTAMLAEAQKHESIGRITSGIAHDFSNLLAIILGNVQLMAIEQQGIAASLEIREIEVACEKGRDLVASLLSFAGRSSLEVSTIDPAASAKECVGLISRTFGSGITLSVDAAGDVWSCDIDRAAFESAILNLCLNARDAMPRGGALTIALENLRVDGRPAADRPDLSRGRYVCMTISDTGHGIADDVLDRVVEPFFTTKGPGTGNGLGLSMVDGFARQSGGAFSIGPRPEGGTQAVLWLPASPDEANDRAPNLGQPAPPQQTEKSAILVEDDAAVRRVMERYLQSLGFGVVSFSSAKGVAEHLRGATTAPVLVSDVDLPGTQSGVELAEQLLEERSDLGVVLVSGHPRSTLNITERFGPRLAFLTKPIQRADLEKALSTLH